MKRVLIPLAIGLLIINLSACGGGAVDNAEEEGSTDGTPAFAAISDLPSATSPMAGNASGSIAKGGVAKAATQGVSLASASAADFSTSSSMAACEMVNSLRQSFESGAEADKILCYVQKMDSLGQVFDNLAGIDIYDGVERVFDIGAVDDGNAGSPDKIKMRIEKTGDTITSFRMYACRDNEQMLYLNMTIDGAVYGMTEKGVFSDVQWSGRHAVSVEGTLNASGLFLTRTIDTSDTGGANSGLNTHRQEAEVIQTPGVFTFSGYQAGSYTSEEGSGTYTSSVYGAGEILNDELALSQWAMGDGAVNTELANTWAGGGYSPDPFIEAWLGDTLQALADVTAGEFYDEASAGTRPVVGDSVNIAFEGEEVWEDCSGDGIELPPADETVFAECGTFDREWINCYDAIQPEQPE